jgi:hypothetical protein
MENISRFRKRLVRDEDTLVHWMNNSLQCYVEKTTSYRFACRSVLLLFLAVSSWASAQPSRQLSTGQLLEYYRSLKNPAQQRILSDELHGGKCSFWITAQLLDQWKDLSSTQRMEIQALIQKISLQKDTIIGHFHIFYDTSGSNTPALFDGEGNQIGGALAYVDSVGAIFNHVWDVEIGILGFNPPPFESGQSCYNISISNRGNGDYGITNFSDLISGTQVSDRYSSNIDIDNDFIGSLYTTQGIQALRVTAAHEFHHAIQLGYGWWGGAERYAYELTSTWMEDVVYTDINDYYQYLKDYFGGSNRNSGFWQGWSFNSENYDGYERCIWAHFLTKRFHTSDVMRGVWERMKNQPFLESTNNELIARGTNLATAFAEFTYWNYFTADRADTVKYYPEGNHYPRFQPLQRKIFQSAIDSLGGDVYSLSSSMYEFDVLSDTLTCMIVNVEVDATDGGTRKVDIVLSSDVPHAPYQEFNNGLMAKVIVADTSHWRSFFSQGILRDTIIRPSLVSSDVWPNPFRITSSQQLHLQFQEVVGAVDVYFYSSSLNLAYSKPFTISNHVIAIGSSDLKSNLSSGIYFIIAKTKDREYRWKVAVIR